MDDKLRFLEELRERLIRISGNDLVNKRLMPGGTGTVINVINEVPTFIVDGLIGGKPFVLDPLRDDEDYLRDEEDNMFFSQSLVEILNKHEKDKEDIPEEELREFKNKAREKSGLPPIEEVIPERKYNLDAKINEENPAHIDGKIQTDIPNDRFQKFLKKLCKSVDEHKREKGIDTCYLAVGFLKWNRIVSGGQRREYNSPIFLVPLEIQESKNKFSIEASGKDYGTNRILIPIFQQEIKQTFPQYVSGDGEKSGVHDYLAKIDTMLGSLNKEGWSFQHRMAIGHFKSTGIPLEELDPKGYSNEQIENFYGIAGIDGGEAEFPPSYNIDSDEITSLVPYTAIKADSSQYSSIVDVAKEKNLVLEGPPGTGKSQTIVNILANAIHHDKKVLFLAQKTAALNVVYNRLEQIGLDNKCMPLHSEYGNKKSLFEKIGNLIRTQNGKSFEDTKSEFTRKYNKYKKERNHLNKYCEFLRHNVGETGLNSQQIMTRYASIKDANLPVMGLDSTKLSGEQIENVLSSAEDIDRAIEKVGRNTVKEIKILKSTTKLDQFHMGDFFSDIEKLYSYFGKRVESAPNQNLASQKEPIERNKKKLSLALQLRETRKILDTNYVKSEIPEPNKLLKLQTLMSEASWFAKLFFPKVAWFFYSDLYRATKRTRSMVVGEVSGYGEVVEHLNKIDTLFKDMSNLENEISSIEGEQRTVEEIESKLNKLSAEFKQDNENIKSLENLCKSDCARLDFSDIHKQIGLIREHREHFNDLVGINHTIKDLETYFSQISDFVRDVLERKSSMHKTLEVAIFESLARSLSKNHPKYQDYNGEFIQNKRNLLASATEELDKLYCKMIQNKPPKGDLSGNRARRVREKTGMNLLKHIGEFPTSRVTVRELMNKSGKALQAFAPCFLMTPSSVSDFLLKEFEFDLLVIDEASQMLVEEAAGSMLRSKQYVVVGDSKQMPPTNYMVSHLAPQHVQQIKNESILERACGAFTSRRRLLYHYRSQHESLIQFSNAEFYKNELMVIPSQLKKTDELGIKHIDVGGEYNPGRGNIGNSTNPNPMEAERIVNDICEFMLDPKNKDCSLGVAALNLRQSQRIEELMYEKIIHNSNIAEYIDRWKDDQEYFFIKNLESVQGDERDVIMISTVFGKDMNNKVFQRFGPINQDQGEKRINVLITRAKKQLRVYTSLKPNDITSEKEGAQVLSRYLMFAETGHLETSRIIAETGTFDSPWEKWFSERLTNDGYQVTSQVGVSGWRIDLGIKHPSYPYGYLCGIELDGASYHSSRYARERDFLRQSILESQGWNIIRVWSTDFFNDKEKVYQGVRQQIKSIADAKIQVVSNPGFAN